MKKLFLNNLPKWGKNQIGNEGTVNWQKCAEIKIKIQFIYNDIEGEIQIIDYNSKARKVTVIYKNKKYFNVYTSHSIRCQISKILGIYTSEFKIEIGKRLINYNKDNSTKRNITIIDREYRKEHHQNFKYYKYKCNICGYDEGWIIESNLLKGTGCACCCPSPQIVIEGINDIPSTAPWMIKYFQGGYDEAKLYTKTSNKPIYPICPDCGRIKDKAIHINKIYNRKSIGCTCSDNQSYPNKFSYALLEQLNKLYKLDYIEHEYSPDWIKPKRYDNYFIYQGGEYILEMDGELGHGNDNCLNGQTKEETLAIDNHKDSLADKHGIQIIRINCDCNGENRCEYIKTSILNNNILNKLFDFSNIDWLKVEEFALSNLVKKVCEYWNIKQEWETTKDLEKIFNINRFTIIRYLKKGNILEWCQYNPKEEMDKNMQRHNNAVMKLVICLNNQKIFNSIKEASKYYKIKNSSSISACCKGKRKSAGKHPETYEPLRWIYYNDYLQLNKK